MLDVAAIGILEQEISSQVQKLYALSLGHYRFALKQPNVQWRQRVSRFYYAAYAASKSVRLYVNGDFSTDAKDHQKVGVLPDDFPQVARFTNQLAVLREDRNTCDYDHDCVAGDLIIRPRDAETLAKEFLTEARSYLAGRGLSLKGAP